MYIYVHRFPQFELCLFLFFTAQKLGLVEAPKGLLSDTEWKELKEKSNARQDSSQPCVICKEDFGLQQQVRLHSPVGVGGRDWGTQQFFFFYCIQHCIPFLTEIKDVPFIFMYYTMYKTCTFHCKWYPFDILTIEALHLISVGLFKIF